MGGVTGVRVTGAGGTTAVARTIAGRLESGFRLPANSGAAAAGKAAGVMELGGMLGLQEQEADAARDRGARRHGQALLRELAALQRALLGGADAAGPLHHLSALARASPEAADPALSAIVRAIALRAAIELARRSS